MSKISISINPPRGVTLVEVLFSAVIIGVVLSGVLFTFVQIVDISRRTDYEYVATNLAKSRIERIRGYIDVNGFDSVTDERFGEDEAHFDQNGVPDENGDFIRSTTITTGYTGSERLTKVDVNLTYEYKQSKVPYTINMSTVFVKMKEEEE